MSKEAMKLAWEAEKKANPQTRYNSWCRGYEAALREALAEQPAQQEPVGEIGKIILFGGQCKEVSWRDGKMPPVGSVLYTSPPPQRTWVGLTPEELDAMFSKTLKGKKLVNWVARAIEAKLKEKNT